MIVGCSVAGGTGNSVAVVAGCSVILHAECSAVGGTGTSVVGGAEDLGAAFLADFAWCHPNLLLCAFHHSHRWSSMVLMGISLSPVWATP